MNTLLQEVELLGDELPWLKEYRAAGREAFARLGIPTAKTEAWKYTKPNRFLSADFVFNPHGKASVAMPDITFPFDACRIYFINGVFAACDPELPAGVEILPLAEALMLRPDIKERLGLRANINGRPFVALNTAYLNEGVYIRVAAGARPEKPVVLVHYVAPGAGNGLYNLRNLIAVEDGAKAEILEYYCYTGEPKSSYLVNVVNEISVAANAALRHYKLQDEAFKAGHLAFNGVEVKAGGLYKAFCLQKGADLARNETKVVLAEENAAAEVDAAYIMNGWATIDTTTDIEHLKPHTDSSQLVKGVVGGQAKGVFQGKIHIAPDAVKTEGYQLHKAMLLSDEAEIDVKPELEIFADDVKCSHGAACGQLDAEQLFYMRSRGISEEDARQMLIDAYLNDVMAKVDDENIRAWIKLSVNSGQSA